MVTKEEKKIIEKILEYCETGKTSMTDEIMHNPVSNYNDPKKLNAEINTLFREFPIIIAHVSDSRSAPLLRARLKNCNCLMVLYCNCFARDLSTFASTLSVVLYLLCICKQICSDFVVRDTRTLCSCVGTQINGPL